MRNQIVNRLVNKAPLAQFLKFGGNPVLGPQGATWEAAAVFNPAAWTDGAEVFLLYRAQGTSNGAPDPTSRLGLARSKDGFSFTRNDEIVFGPTELYEKPGGCEDPRLVRINDEFYLTYTAYDGRIARLAMAVTKDFRSWQKLGPVFSDEQWDEFCGPRHTRTAGVPRGWSKSGAILPQMIHGRYWMYFGDTQIWAASSLDLRSWQVIPQPVLSPRAGYFDSKLVEPGPSPIITQAGIILLYNSADQNIRYSVGQAIFALDDPTQLIQRENRPLLIPTTEEELSGQVNHVVFAEGLVYFKSHWLLYYGMADSRIGVAVAELGPPFMPI